VSDPADDVVARDAVRLSVLPADSGVAGPDDDDEGADADGGASDHLDGADRLPATGGAPLALLLVATALVAVGAGLIIFDARRAGRS
jgi:hypothetical protein